MDPFDLAGLREYLSEADLKKMCSTDDLGTVRVLETQVDIVNNGVGALGELRNLKELKLTGSLVGSLRDLGTGLRGVEVLWLGRSGVENLGGAGGFPKLQELYIAFNNVRDLSPLSTLRDLQILDAESNRIVSIDNVGFLSNCGQLHTLTLEGNPISSSAGYRSCVFSMIPSLQFLDDSEDQDDLYTAAEPPPDLGEKLLEINRKLDISTGYTHVTHSEYIQGLFEEQLKQSEPTTAATEEEKIEEEMKSIVKRVKEARFVDPYSPMDLSDDEEDEDVSSDLDDDDHVPTGGRSAAEFSVLWECDEDPEVEEASRRRQQWRQRTLVTK